MCLLLVVNSNEQLIRAENLLGRQQVENTRVKMRKGKTWNFYLKSRKTTECKCFNLDKYQLFHHNP